MTDTPKPPRLARAIRATLGALRRRVRAYVWLYGLAALVAWSGVMFWGSLLADWFFEPSGPVRIAMLTFAGVGGAVIAVRLILRRAFRRLTDANMAMLLEHYFPEFDDSLLTAVLLSGQELTGEQCNPRMLAQTCELAAQPVGQIRLSRVFNLRPLRWLLLAALLFTGSVAGHHLLFPEAFDLWSRRTLLLSPELWPRRIKLTVDGFEDGQVKIARGADIDVVAMADLRGSFELPGAVRIRYRNNGGARVQKSMSREGAADPGVDPFQQYGFTFHGVLEPIEFDLLGKCDGLGRDTIVRGLRIVVVDSPALVEPVLECRFPTYMQRDDRELVVTGLMALPLGAQISLRAASTKPLVRVEIQSEERRQNIEQSDPSRAFGRFRYNLRPFVEDRTILLTLVDTDGVRSREPVALTLATLADRPPELTVLLRGVGSAITPQAQLPAAGQAVDDYGLDRIWFDYTIDEADSAEEPIASIEGNATEAPIKQAFDLRPLGLAPGERLVVSVKASDHYDLNGDQANVGSSDRWTLDVVTEKQLRAILEAREIVLRQRFQAIIEEMVETGDLLDRMQFEPPSSEEEDPPSSDQDAGAEPGDTESKESPPDSGESAEHLLRICQLRLQRALQNSQKGAHETSGVGRAFSDIREELINNRIYTEELRIRIEEHISGPIDRIVDQMFPELDRRLDGLETQLDATTQGQQTRALARQQVGAIVNAMRDVLDRMIELEDFNEAVEMLRAIIAAEEKLREQTEQRQKQKLRELLED